MFWLTGLLGIVLGLAPFVFGFANNPVALWITLILGAVVVIASVIGVLSPRADTRWAHWVIGAAGVAALIAPFIFGYNTGSPLWTNVVLGAVLVVFELVKDAVASVEAPAR